MRRRFRPRHEAPDVVDPGEVAGRVPPHNLDAEAAVLSACMLTRHASDAALLVLRPEHFYSESNARIFQAIQHLAITRTPIDVVAVGGWLHDREWLPKIGGTAYLAQLADATPTIGHVSTHARMVFGKWRVRQAIATHQRFAAEGYGDVGDEDEWLKAGAEATDALAHGNATQKQLVGLATPLRTAFTKIQDAAARGDRILGIPTGYDRLDAKIAGLNDGDLVIVAGRPGMAKTSLALNVAANVASPRMKRVEGQDVSEPGFGVCVFSLEMPEDQCAVRMACSEGKVDLGRVRQGQLQPDDWRKLTEGASYLSNLPIWIDDTPAIGLLELRAKVRRQQAAFDREATSGKPAQRIGLVVVDYLQLMKGREDAPSREQEISEISRGLKALAKELNVCVMALSQLNRAAETRGKDKRPQLSDLRESGAIEQDADTVIMLYRDEYYNPETTAAKGIAELIIAKQRNGPTGKVKVRFNASCTRFDNLEPGDYPEIDDE
jgi:replicative DNA helicase